MLWKELILILNGMKNRGGGYFGMGLSVVHFGCVLSIDLYFYVHSDDYISVCGEEGDQSQRMIIIG